MPVIPAQLITLGWDRAIAVVAARQHGVIARFQLLELGLTRHAIQERMRRGTLHPLDRGVYAVGYPRLSQRGRWMAAVLACGGRGVLSHRSAAALWGIRADGRPVVDVTAPTAHRYTGIAAHRGRLPADEVTVLDAIPVTVVPRTLLDLAPVLDRAGLETALNEVEVRRLTATVSLPELLERCYPNRRGSRTLRAILADRRMSLSISRSELETRFLAFLMRRGLPLPEMNVHLPVSDRLVECDCVWREARLVVELDGRATHGSIRAFERDRARDRALVGAGWRVVRVTWRQLHDEPDALARDLAGLIVTGR